MISAAMWLCLGIFLGATYPFVWGFIKAQFTKVLNMVKKTASEDTKDDNQT